MSSKKRTPSASTGHRAGIVALLCLLALAVAAPDGLAARKKQRRQPRKSQVDDKRVYLIHADRLHYDQWQNSDAQVLNGKVQFRHQGATLHCDSAHFYEASNSFEAFGNVKMFQGDTLSLFSDYAFYDGNDQLAIARKNVKLKNRHTTLFTDSLNYDRLYDNAYFFEGGKLVDGSTTLTSDWGEYNTKTKRAVFNFNVKMRDKDFYLEGDTLYYDTQTSMAEISGPTNITSGGSKIYSERGFYDTKREMARLMDRSVLRDGARTLVGDSIYYGGKNALSKAFRNVVYTDTLNKNMLKCEYGEYNESTGYAMCTDSAVCIDFSQKDTLYLHADTLKLFTFNINTDSVYRCVHAYYHVRAYRLDLQGVCDSLVYNQLDSCMTMYRDPIVWNNNQQLLGERIDVFMRDSTVDHAHVIKQAFSVQQLRDSVHFNQVSSDEMYAFFVNGDIRETQAQGNVLIAYHFEDDADSSLICLNSQETTEMRMYMDKKKLQRVWTPKSSGVLYPMNQIPPDKGELPGFAWFDYVRPLHKDDIFDWRPKKAGTELKSDDRPEAPRQRISPSAPAMAAANASPAAAVVPAEAAKAAATVVDGLPVDAATQLPLSLPANE